MTRFFAPSSPYYNTADAGAGGGAAASGQQGAGGGQGSQGSQGAGGGQQGASAPVSFSDDTMFIPPGAKEPVKWGDYSKQYVPASQVEAQTGRVLQQFITNLAKANQGKAKQPQNTRTQAHQPAADPFEGLRDLPLVDGRTLATLGERIQKEGLAPLYEWGAKINQVLEALGKKVQLTEKATGSLIENRSRGEFEQKMQSAVAALAKDVLPGVNIAEHPVLNEFAQDVYLSYDPNDPTLEKEFPGLLKNRLDGILKLANALNQAKLQQARETRRNFLRPGGQGQASGQGRPDRLSHAQIAANMFAADASRT